MNVAVRTGYPPLHYISVCTGGGGLDRGVELAMPNARPACLVEREAFAVHRLGAAIEQGLLAPAPIWSNARTFRGRPWRGLVDGFVAGIPCQPHSLAGKRLGREDERDLWGTARRIIVQSGAWWVLIENVEGMLTSGGAERVWRDLGRLGFAREIGLFTAEEVGLPQIRQRVFILAVADPDVGREQQSRRDLGEVGGRAFDGGEGLADAERHRAAAGVPAPAAQNGEPPEPAVTDHEGNCLGDAERRRRGGQFGRRPNEIAAYGQFVMGGPDRTRWPSAGPGSDQQAGCEPEPGRRNMEGPASCATLAEPGRDGCRAGRPAPASDDDRRGGARVAQGDQPGPRGDTLLVDAIGGRRHGRAHVEIGAEESRAAAEFAGEGPLVPPGPGDGAAWADIAERYPERLPAISRHDLFRIALRKAGAAVDGDPRPRAWLDAQTGEALRPAVVQEIAQRTLRGMADGLAARVDELRMLGNGVVDLEAAYAVRTLAARLAASGSAGAAQLVRMMGE